MVVAGLGLDIYMADLSNIEPLNATNLRQLSRIDFPNGYTVFNYSSRSDGMFGAAFERLSSIEIYESSGSLLKKVTLNQSYFTGNRLRLDGITEQMRDNGLKKNYLFSYNTATLPTVEVLHRINGVLRMGRPLILLFNASRQVTYNSTNYVIGNADRTNR